MDCIRRRDEFFFVAFGRSKAIIIGRYCDGFLVPSEVDLQNIMEREALKMIEDRQPYIQGFKIY